MRAQVPEVRYPYESWTVDLVDWLKPFQKVEAQPDPEPLYETPLKECFFPFLASQADVLSARLVCRHWKRILDSGSYRRHVHPGRLAIFDYFEQLKSGVKYDSFRVMLTDAVPDTQGKVSEVLMLSLHAVIQAILNNNTVNRFQIVNYLTRQNALLPQNARLPQDSLDRWCSGLGGLMRDLFCPDIGTCQDLENPENLNAINAALSKIKHFRAACHALISCCAESQTNFGPLPELAKYLETVLPLCSNNPPLTSELNELILYCRQATPLSLLNPQPGESKGEGLRPTYVRVITTDSEGQIDVLSQQQFKDWTLVEQQLDMFEPKDAVNLCDSTGLLLHPIHIPVTNKALQQALSFQKARLELFGEELETYWICFSQADLFEAILASNALGFRPMIDSSCKYVANLIKGKTPEQIRQTFNIRNEFTPEEEEQVRKENEWCED